MTTAFYRVGTISAQLNSKVVTGHGTSWTLGANKVISGDVLLYNNSKMYEVEHVISDTEIHLFTPFQDANITQQPYAILRNASLNISSRIAASVAIAINQKQQQLNEFNAFLTSTAPTVNMTDTTGNVIAVIPIPTLVKTINDLVNDASTITAVVQEGKTARDQAVAAKNASETALASVTTIKSEVTQLKTDVEGLKTDTETAKSAAASSASAAAGSVTAAAAEVAKAATEVSNAAAEVTKAKAEVQHAKDQVAIAAGHASASATSESNAGASATAAANSAQLAQAAIVPMRNEAEMWEMIRRNKDLYAASQFINFGNHHHNNTNIFAINEGMYAYTAEPNALHLGRHGTSTALGLSETQYPMTAVAGFVSKLIGVNSGVVNTPSAVQIIFPEAPDGTVIYDSTGSARGTGKASLDLSVNADPLYGDIASSHNEAVARAFGGGFIKNSDFRDGTAEWNPSLVSVANGVATIVGDNNNAGAVGSSNLKFNLSGGTEYIIEIACTRYGGAGSLAFTNNSLIHVAARVNKVGTIKVKFTADSSDPNYFFWLLGCDLDIESFRLYRATEEVVIAPHDVFGMEYWLEEVSQAKPDVFDCGMVQSKAASSNGVATSASSRSQTYHAAFKGDTTTGHKSVNFFTATFEQQCKLAAKEENNLFRLNDGRIVQWRGRQLTFRGAGNGDWEVINPQTTNTFRYSAQDYVRPQGALDVPNWVNDWYRGSLHNDNNHRNTGIFTAQSSNTGLFGLCFFQVWGEVPRFNQGAFHMTLNPMGARRWNKIDGTGANYWYQNTVGNITSASQAFHLTLAAGEIGAHPNTGSMSTKQSGRYDGRFYDQPHSEGQGGIIDYRVSAHDMGSKEEAAKVFHKVVNGTYRGKERMTFSRVMPEAYPTATSKQHYFISPLGNWGGSDMLANCPWRVGDMLIKVDKGVIYQSRITSISNDNNVNLFVKTESDLPRTADTYTVVQQYTSTVSGEFTMMDVVGDPAEILATPALANGWLGSWIPVIPDGTAKRFPYTRKNIGAVGDGTDAITTSDRGQTWNRSGITTVGDAANIFGNTNQSVAAERIYIIPYTAFAKQTKESKSKKVLNAYEGIGKVFAVNNFHADNGVLFAESLIGKVNTANPVGFSRNILDMTNMWLLGDSGLLGYNAQYHPQEHVPIRLVQDGNSPAVKALWSQASVNQQATLQFNWNELVYQNFTDGGSKDIATNFAFVAGSRYRISSAASMDFHWYCSFGLTAKGSELSLHPDGKTIVGAVSGNRFGYIIRPTQQGDWGDDSRIRIKDGVGTFINLNGDTCLYGTSELAIPYGYTKNQARAGSQVAGVDL